MDGHLILLPHAAELVDATNAVVRHDLENQAEMALISFRLMDSGQTEIQVLGCLQLCKKKYYSFNYQSAAFEMPLVSFFDSGSCQSGAGRTDSCGHDRPGNHITLICNTPR